MAPPSALPRLRGQTDSRFALVSALVRGQPKNIYHSTEQQYNRTRKTSNTKLSNRIWGS
jgi:hypothetical protein